MRPVRRILRRWLEVAQRDGGAPGPDESQGAERCDNPYCGSGTRMSARSCAGTHGAGPYNSSVHVWPFRG